MVAADRNEYLVDTPQRLQQGKSAPLFCGYFLGGGTTWLTNNYFQIFQTKKAWRR